MRHQPVELRGQDGQFDCRPADAGVYRWASGAFFPVQACGSLLLCLPLAVGRGPPPPRFDACSHRFWRCSCPSVSNVPDRHQAVILRTSRECGRSVTMCIQPVLRTPLITRRAGRKLGTSRRQVSEYVAGIRPVSMAHRCVLHVHLGFVSGCTILGHRCLNH